MGQTYYEKTTLPLYLYRQAARWDNEFISWYQRFNYSTAYWSQKSVLISPLFSLFESWYFFIAFASLHEGRCFYIAILAVWYDFREPDQLTDTSFYLIQLRLYGKRILPIKSKFWTMKLNCDACSSQFCCSVFIDIELSICPFAFLSFHAKK